MYLELDTVSPSVLARQAHRRFSSSEIEPPQVAVVILDHGHVAQPGLYPPWQLECSHIRVEFHAPTCLDAVGQEASRAGGNLVTPILFMRRIVEEDVATVWR